jgi:anti-sigma factor ChrR (cupin superfamily)
MTRSTLLAIAAAIAVASCAAQAPDADVEITTEPDITSGAEPIFIPATELEWFDLDPQNAPGVRLATLWGDPESGAFGAYMRLPAGFNAPLHTHTHAMKVVMVSGTYIQEPDGGSVVHLGPGSFMMQPGSDYRHRTSCGTDMDCVFFVESGGAFDMFVVEDAPSRD